MGFWPRAIAGGTITIDHTEFAANGKGDGYTHNIYVGKIGTLQITNSYIHDAVVGHEIKSRADNTIILNNRIIDGNWHGELQHRSPQWRGGNDPEQYYSAGTEFAERDDHQLRGRDLDAVRQLPASYQRQHDHQSEDLALALWASTITHPLSRKSRAITSLD